MDAFRDAYGAFVDKFADRHRIMHSAQNLVDSSAPTHDLQCPCQNIALQLTQVASPYLVWGRAVPATHSGCTQPIVGVLEG